MQKNCIIFFADAVKNLNIPNYEYCGSLAENIDDPTLKAIAKWRNHQSILAIASEYKNRENFSFNFVSKKDVLTEIKVLGVSKAFQESDIPVKIIKIVQVIVSKEQKWILFIALGKHPKYPKALYLDHFCSIYLCVTCSYY